jgi:hypothetical protein
MVVKWKEAYHMWYGKLWMGQRWVGYAISDDGITWQPAWHAVLGPTGVEGAFDELEATHGWVIPEGDTLKMWYSGAGSQSSGIGLAWSIDGIGWTRTPGPTGGNSVLDPAADGAGALVVTHPTVVRAEGVYHMWYVRVMSTAARIGYARSVDGRFWQVVSGSGANGAVLDLGTGNEFDAIAIQWPAAIQNQDHFEMWYQGLGFDPVVTVVPRLGCARSSDGIVWEKIPGDQAEAGACFNSFAQPSILLEDGLYRMWYGLSATGQNGDVVMYATSGEIGTAVERDELPSIREAIDIYPNPTASRATVRFYVEKPAAFVLEVHDMLGRRVSRIDLGQRMPGEQDAIWRAMDTSAADVPTGAYVLTIANSSTGERSAGGLVHVLR